MQQMKQTIPMQQMKQTAKENHGFSTVKLQKVTSETLLRIWMKAAYFDFTI